MFTQQKLNILQATEENNKLYKQDENEYLLSFVVIFIMHYFDTVTSCVYIRTIFCMYTYHICT